MIVLFERNGGYKFHEKDQDINKEELEGIYGKGRLRRVPDILPVCMQDFLYRRKSELREHEPLVFDDGFDRGFPYRIASRR
jgi:hypothetical protein